MPNYQVLARKYRPQLFQDVLGQEAIVTTLKNAIKFNRLAHAYLFSGSRGTGKTTLARLFAKALNCQQPDADGEPCNKCSSCKEITSGNSFDVLEIDGASHRGIDDIRQINETVGYATASGKYKIYIIDEVHMLTKEAFNALLKTLEEPPPKVKFFFATTEPHKVPPTILSRCQRFNLNRIPLEQILAKLKRIASDLNLIVEEEALAMIAHRAEGGLRDAESLLDQIISFQEGSIDTQIVSSALGIMSKDCLFDLDEEGKKGNFAVAFEIAHQVFSQGKDPIHFAELIVEHFRQLLIIKLSEKNVPYLEISEKDRARYEKSAALYTHEQCMTIMEFLMEAQNQMRFTPSNRIALESLLLRIIRTHFRVPVDALVRRLVDLEQKIKGPPPEPTSSPVPEKSYSEPVMPSPIPAVTPPVQKELPSSSMSEDPTPTPEDLGKKRPAKTAPADLSKKKPSTENAPITLEKQNRYDTILQFAAVELEGTIQKKQVNSI